MEVRVLSVGLSFRIRKCYNSNMKTFIYSLMLQVEVEAPDEDAAAEAISDCFGEGDSCGLMVQNVEVLDFEELT